MSGTRQEAAAFRSALSSAGCPMQLLGSAEAGNVRQKLVLPDKIVQRFRDDLSGKTIIILGLAFKPNADDMREAPSRTIVPDLARRGACIRAYDLIGAKEAARVLGGVPGLSIVDSAAAAVTRRCQEAGSACACEESGLAAARLVEAAILDHAG